MTTQLFSIVVPTMWKYNPFIQFLTDLVLLPAVDEIIIINNDTGNTPKEEILNHPKIRLVNTDCNIYVNPAWNLGVNLSKNKHICILNDDIVFDSRVFHRVQEFLSPDIGVIGISFGDPAHNQPKFETGSITIKPWEGENTIGFGTLMFIHKDSWVEIPQSLKVYYGDNWVFDTALLSNKKNYLITDMLHFTPHAQTSSTMVENFFDTETEMYKIELDTWKNKIVSMQQLEEEYVTACNTPSDIHEHLPVLKALANEVNHVTEMGVRFGVSTRAFLNTNAVLRSYDIAYSEEVQRLFNLAKLAGKDASYMIKDVTLIDIETTDLLFIDTLHTYQQLSTELKLHNKNVKKYIAFHDTHTFGTRDESNLPGNGLLPAIIEFLIQHPEWKFKEHRVNNNGLTILERI